MAEMMNTKNEYKPLAFDSIQIGLASPEDVKAWSKGEVTKPETINYRTLKPEKDGLFCEKIFGPIKDWECHCGKYKKIKYKGVVCDRCGVEVTKSSVRRERMGHIELAAPVSHLWYFKGTPSRIALVLDIPAKKLEDILYFNSHVVLASEIDSVPVKTVLKRSEYDNLKDEYGEKAFKVGMGAEAIEQLLKEVDLTAERDAILKILTETKKNGAAPKDQKLLKRLDTLNAFIKSGNRPEWMIIRNLPVISPDLRPMVQLDGGRFATSDLNDLYRRIINRNNRLRKLLEGHSPDVIIQNEKRMLQEAVDSLIDNGRRGRAVKGAGSRELKSLSDMLKGKQGRFRQNLLGKRVDYSGRSVIVVGPELKIYQCGVPKDMALELFKPFVMKELKERGLAQNAKGAKKMVESASEHLEVWDVLEDVIHEHPVMLNRAPTLHRLGIQAFEPILVEGKAIKLHPLVCTAFNADFDGDQMAIHLPLSEEAQAECRFLMLSPNNLLKPSDGGPVAVPSQDMVLGIYYLTQKRRGEKGEGAAYSSMDEAVLAYENGYLGLHAEITVRVTRTVDGKEKTGLIKTTLGRMIFNNIIPQDLGFVDRKKKDNKLVPEIDKLVGKKELKQILERVIDMKGATKTAEVLDDIKALGYKYSTKAAMTVSVADMMIPEEKDSLVAAAQEKVAKINKNFTRGLINEDQRHQEVVKAWQETDDDMTNTVYPALQDPALMDEEKDGRYNSIFMMADSGARGSRSQIKQLVGWRGLFQKTNGYVIELPVMSNFREGLDVLEYFMSAHGSRKGMSDTALRTADSGYLTRRLVDVSQEIIIREEDCCREGDEIPYMEVREIEKIESLSERIIGRFSAEDILDEKTGEVLVRKNEMITKEDAKDIVKIRKAVKIRNNLSCRSLHGVCAKCYGANMATMEPVQVGEAVGIIAAQSIGEPGTQLTMRTFHTGGTAGSDITQGLPRVEELFEARNPKGAAIISNIDGVIQIEEKGTKKVIVNNGTEIREYKIPVLSHLAKVDGTELKEGMVISAGDRITEGPKNPKDILEILGDRAVQDYMVAEVQKPYRLQGVEINDKHIEIIVRQMLRKAEILNPGDTGYLAGAEADALMLRALNKELEEQGKTPATFRPVIKGITKAALATDSFLSAASFQETTRVLTEAAINGKTDMLSGIKENVIIGNLIPAGTGMRELRHLKLSTDESVEQEIERLMNPYDEALLLAEQSREEKAGSGSEDETVISAYQEMTAHDPNEDPEK